MYNSIATFFIFIIILYLSFIYANNKFKGKKEVLIVKDIPIPSSYKDYFKQKDLVIKYAELFGKEARELNLINSTVYGSVDDTSKKMLVPQRNFIS